MFASWSNMSKLLLILLHGLTGLALGDMNMRTILGRAAHKLADNLYTTINHYRLAEGLCFSHSDVSSNGECQSQPEGKHTAKYINFSHSSLLAAMGMPRAFWISDTPLKKLLITCGLTCLQNLNLNCISWAMCEGRPKKVWERSGNGLTTINNQSP